MGDIVYQRQAAGTTHSTLKSGARKNSDNAVFFLLRAEQR
jgi:hypothetical protein